MIVDLNDLCQVCLRCYEVISHFTWLVSEAKELTLVNYFRRLVITLQHRHVKLAPQ